MEKRDSIDTERQLEAIAERYLDQLQKGETPERDALVARHSELGELLEKRLAVVELVHEAMLARSAGAAPGESAEVASPPGGSPVAGDSMRLQCPHCGQRVQIVRRVRKDVTCVHCGSSFTLAAEPGAPPSARDFPATIGRFHLLDLLGEGAFGAVYKARDRELERDVALKVPRSGSFGTREEEERFLREARTAAQLKHVGIVEVHDIGYEEGVPYIVSDCVEGATLADVCSEGLLDFRESARLLMKVAGAVDYAHAQGVVHRDLKPSNILVDGLGQPHVSDFGLARRDEGEITITLDGQVLGTPAYMSPEQASGQATVDARSDVYSLGAVLYELLTGETPFRGNRRMLMHQVLNDDPRPPRSLNDHIPRDLETVCLKAMSKDPARRYLSARDLGDDLRRFLQGEPIRARPVGRLERAWRWCQRNPRSAALGAVVGALLLLLVAGSTGSALWILNEQRKTEAAAEESDRRLVRFYIAGGTRRLEEQDLVGSLPWLAEALRLDRDRPAKAAIHRIRLGWALRECPEVLKVWDGTRARFTPDSRYVLIRMKRASQFWEVESLQPVGSPMIVDDDRRFSQAMLSGAEGPRLVRASYVRPGPNVEGSGLVRVWEATTRMEMSTLQHELPVWSVRISPDARWIVTKTRHSEELHAKSYLQLWDAATGEAVTQPLIPAKGDFDIGEFSPDGSRVVILCHDTRGQMIAETRAGLFEVLTGALRVTVRHEDGACEPELSPDGSRVVTAIEDNAAQVWDALTGEPVTPPLQHRQSLSCAAFSPDGSRVVTASADKTARVWDALTGEPFSEPLQHREAVGWVAFSPDGQRVLTSAGDGARLWSTRGDPLTPLLYHSTTNRGGRLSPDGRYVFTSAEGTVRLWDVTSKPVDALALKHKGGVYDARFSPDGSRVVTASHDGTARVWDALTGDPVTPFLKQGGSYGIVKFSPDGRLVLTGIDQGEECEVKVWSVATGELLSPPRRCPPLGMAVFSPDSRRVVTADVDGNCQIWDPFTGTPVMRPILAGKDLGFRDAAFSSDGRRLFLWRWGDGAGLWDVSTDEPIPLFPEQEVSIVDASFSPDGSLLLTAESAGVARLWDLTTGQPEGASLRHKTLVRSARFSSDARSIVTASDDRTARIWDVATRQPITPAMSHPDVVTDAVFSPDDRLVVTICVDGGARIWDAATGTLVAPPLGRFASFSPDSARLLTNQATMALVWELDGQRTTDELLKSAEWISGQRIDETGTVAALPKDLSRQEARIPSQRDR